MTLSILVRAKPPKSKPTLAKRIAELTLLMMIIMNMMMMMMRRRRRRGKTAIY